MSGGDTLRKTMEDAFAFAARSGAETSLAGEHKNQQHDVCIMAFPRHGDSYVESFYPPLEALGVKVCEGQFSGRWLIRHLRNIDYLHIHWPSFFYSKPKRMECLSGFALFSFLLALACWRNVRVVWTVHNLYPHERCVIPQLDRIVRWLLVRMGALFLVHGASAEAEVLREFPAAAGRTVVIEHGHWIGSYPNSMSCRTARTSLGLTKSEFVFLFLGTCNPYKNLEGLIRAFEELPGSPALLIAGRFQDAAYETKIKAAIQASSGAAAGRILLRSGFVPDEDLQIYLRACDAVVIPYSKVLSSGSAILAMSFGRPVIAPAMGDLRDLVLEGCGVLYDPSKESTSLPEAMRAAMAMEFDEARIAERASRLDWGETAKIVASALACLGRRENASAAWEA